MPRSLQRLSSTMGCRYSKRSYKTLSSRRWSRMIIVFYFVNFDEFFIRCNFEHCSFDRLTTCNKQIFVLLARTFIICKFSTQWASSCWKNCSNSICYSSRLLRYLNRLWRILHCKFYFLKYIFIAKRVSASLEHANFPYRSLYLESANLSPYSSHVMH